MEDDSLKFEGDAKKEKFAMGYILTKAVEKVIECGAKPTGVNEADKDAFFSSISVLDATLTPYKDKEYKVEQEKIAAKTEPRDRIVTIDEFLLLYGLCMGLINKAGFMPMENKNLWDEYDDSKPGFFEA